MNKPIAIMPILAHGGHKAANAPEGSAASGKALGEIACLSSDDSLRRLSSTASGLTTDQVAERLRSAGLNQVAHQARHTILGELIGRSINPLNLLLLSLATASYFLGDQRAAIVIAVMVLLSISLSFIQEHRSNNAADKLQRMVSINATVRRQASAEAHDHVDVPIEQLVPGDIVLLSAGDMIPADLRLISAKDLFVNQSTLTGEAMPLEKVAAAHIGVAETPFDLPNICFMGSAVVSGIGCGVVVLTGPRTAFGLVASAIAKQRVLTSFDKGITRFTWLMLGFIVVMAPLVFVAVVHRLELAAVDRDAGLREQANHSAQRDKARAYLTDGSAIVLTEVGNRLVIGDQPARQPHHFNIVPGFTLKPSARLNPVEIAVNIELQQDRRMIRRPASYLGIDPVKPKLG